MTDLTAPLTAQLTAGHLAETMAALEACLTAPPLDRRPTVLKVGVDLGTAYTVLVALDESDRPLAVAQ